MDDVVAVQQSTVNNGYGIFNLVKRDVLDESKVAFRWKII